MFDAYFFTMLQRFNRNRKIMRDAARKLRNRFVSALFQELSTSHSFKSQIRIFIPQKLGNANEAIFHLGYDIRFFEDVKGQKSPHFWGLRLLTSEYRHHLIPQTLVAVLSSVVQSLPLLVQEQLQHCLAH